MHHTISKEGYLEYTISGDDHIIDSSQLQAECMEKVEDQNLEWDASKYVAVFTHNTAHGAFVFRVFTTFAGENASIESVEVDKPNGTSISSNRIRFNI